jgi:hypothetical protein
MLFKNWLYFSPEGASGGEGAAGVTSADAGQSTGETAADAGQTMEGRLEQLGVPRDKIRKGAYKATRAAAPVAKTEEPETETPESGAADRKPWEEIKAGYKADFDAEVQNIVQARVKREQEKSQQYADRQTKLAPLVDFFSAKYGLDPENLDVDALVQKFREDSSLSEERAMETGTSAEVAHKLDLVEQEERRMERERKAREQELAAAFQRQQTNDHFDNLMKQANELAAKIPGFNLMTELENSSFAEMTRPGSPVTVEQAYYALHPEYRQAEAESVARRATEGVAAAVRAGQSRPAENGAQAASVGQINYRNMSRADREALKKRIYAAGARGDHLPIGG